MNVKKPFYSIGIIFKNEIRCLERCLKSLKPIQDVVPCEIVMADTGSTDGSRAVAERYADIVFDFPWIDDFAAARNAVVERCSGVWYMSVDADEWFNGDAKELLAFSKIKDLKDDIAGYVIRNCKSEEREASDDYMDFTAIRMMRLSAGLRYKDCIHESFIPERNSHATMLGHTLFYHDGYYYGTRAQMEQKRQRNLALLKKKLEDDPDNLQTVTEYIDSMKAADSDVVPTETIVETVKRSLELLHGNWERWGPYGATVYRNAVSIAKLHNQPELIQWAEKASELFPDSLYTRIDVSYYAFSRCWDEKKVEDAIRWGERYLTAMEDYRAGRFVVAELMRGVLEYTSPLWERKLRIVLAQAYLELDKPEKTLEMLASVDGSVMDEVAQIEACVNIMMRLYRVTDLDIVSYAARLWEQIGRPEPSEEEAEKRRQAFRKTGRNAFELSFIADELKKEGFRRHSYTLFLPLEECGSLSAFAAMLEEPDRASLAEKMSRWEGDPIPVSVLFHAMEAGVPFPLPGKPQTIESMGALANQLAKEPERLHKLVLAGVPVENAQQICWAGSLALAAVQSCPWKTAEEQEIKLARRFAEEEKQFLSAFYTPELLTEENVLLLPSLHRFGWYFVRAFEALDGGDPVEYVRLLREGLRFCTAMNPMVDFLVKYTPELQLKPEPSAELKALANQIRAVLANFSPDDPAVAALKQSEAYRKVAHLIEGAEAPVMGGLKQ